MAKQKVMTPGAVGGSKFGNEEEFTFNDLLDSIIERNIENQKNNRRDEDFKAAFKSMVATPREYTEWQDKGYAKSNEDESIRRLREEHEAAVLESNRRYPEASEGHPQQMSDDDASAYRQQMEDIGTLPLGALLGAIPPSDQPIYKDTDLIDSGYGITQQDLDIQKQWWEEDESEKSFRRTDADWKEYSRIEDLVEKAKSRISDEDLTMSDRRSKKIKKRY